MKIIRAIRYRQMRYCLAEFFSCKVKDIKNQKGFWESMDLEGKTYYTPIPESLEGILKANCWGFVDTKNRILHYFARAKTPMDELVELFAHEIGHLERPYHRGPKEEYKANVYADVAKAAFVFAEEVKRGEPFK